MAFYGDKENVKESNKPEKYQKLWDPGDKPNDAGIYKCQTCGFEDLFNRACAKVPPCSVCKEKTKNWKLLVRAEDK